MKKQRDYCTWFPEYWYRWVKWYKWEKIYIGDCCKTHDDTCSTSKFLKCLREKRAVGNSIITIGGALGCWAKYTSKMFRRV
jgi:hypothetical protein